MCLQSTAGGSGAPLYDFTSRSFAPAPPPQARRSQTRSVRRVAVAPAPPTRPRVADAPGATTTTHSTARSRTQAQRSIPTPPTCCAAPASRIVSHSGHCAPPRQPRRGCLTSRRRCRRQTRTKRARAAPAARPLRAVARARCVRAFASAFLGLPQRLRRPIISPFPLNRHLSPPHCVSTHFRHRAWAGGSLVLYPIILSGNSDPAVWMITTLTDFQASGSNVRFDTQASLPRLCRLRCLRASAFMCVLVFSLALR